MRILLPTPPRIQSASIADPKPLASHNPHIRSQPSTIWSTPPTSISKISILFLIWFSVCFLLFFGFEMSSLVVFDLIRLFFLVAGFRACFCAREIVGGRADLAADAAVDLNLTSFNGALKESPASYAVVEFFAHWFVDLPTTFWFTVCVVVSAWFVGFRWILFRSVVRQSVL